MEAGAVSVRVYGKGDLGALGRRQLRQNRLLSFVEISMSLRKLRPRLRIHRAPAFARKCALRE
jgi:hypothetical protein